MSVEFAIGEMTRFETAEDGSSVRLDMEDVNGRLVSLHMPLKCLNRLIMTLPEIVGRALQRSTVMLLCGSCIRWPDFSWS